MANTVKIKMKCVGLRPASVGSDEVVTLERRRSTNAAEDNAQGANQASVFPSARLEIPIGRGAAAQGQFIKGMTYTVGFTEVTLEA